MDTECDGIFRRNEKVGKAKRAEKAKGDGRVEKTGKAEELKEM